MEPKYVKILVVDDESSVRILLKKILDAKGYLCTMAKDSGEARKHLETQYFDILMCDIRMPGESGLDLIRFVKPKFPETAIIMITGVDDPQETEAALDLGVFGYLLKPFRRNQILINISNALKLNELEKKDREERQDLTRNVQEKTCFLEKSVQQLDYTQEALRNSKDEIKEKLFFFQTLIDSIPNPVTYKDITGRYMGCNISFEECCGFKKDEIIGKYPKDIMTGYDVELHSAADRDLIQEGHRGEIKYEALINYPDGSMHDVIFNKGVYRNINGQVSGIINVFQDITEIKKLDCSLMQEKERYREIGLDLEEKNGKLQNACSELKETQARIIQQEKMASIGQLAAGVAHEINNPTGFIGSNLNTFLNYQGDLFKILSAYRSFYSRFVKEAGESDVLLNDISEIKSLESELDIDFIMQDLPGLIRESIEGTERIQKIVMDLKDFAHPGKKELEYTDINKSIDSTLNIVWNEIKYKASVHKEYGDIPEVLCHPNEINQVFMNLLVNAAQAIEEQGDIHIKTTAINEVVRIQITDSGMGIPEENISKIFEPFFTTKEVGKGTGLGLHLVYNIINKHRGKIHVSSNVGKGTTFTIDIPANEQ